MHVNSFHVIHRITGIVRPRSHPNSRYRSLEQSTTIKTYPPASTSILALRRDRGATCPQVKV
ncbi:hypothetical protein B0O99DRAFT_402610 [Bisporella sp. PMI_857]|nr:hypothetical protein B0O99DRAFT_402610 [Bisporella sp. PMI_857]